MKDRLPPTVETELSLATQNKPLRLAAFVAGAYGAASLLYIYASSRTATIMAADIAQLERIELIKGYLFVLSSSLLIFALLFLLFKRLRHREELIERQREAFEGAEKRAAAGLFASSVAHDLNNVLMVCQYCVGELCDNEKLDSQKELLEELQGATNQICEYARSLAVAGGKHLSSGIRETDAAAVVAEAVALARMHGKLKKCVIDADIPDALMAEVDASVLYRVVLNMLLNAGDAAEECGQIALKFYEREHTVCLEVHDNGPGIPEAERKRVIEPFYTTKADGSGLGFLSIKHFTAQHNGAMGIDDSPLGGACVYVRFPKRQKAHLDGKLKNPILKESRQDIVPV